MNFCVLKLIMITQFEQSHYFVFCLRINKYQIIIVISLMIIFHQ